MILVICYASKGEMICMYAQLLLFVKLNYIAQFHGELMCAEYYLLVVFQEW
jgi:hypothetical protein